MSSKAQSQAISNAEVRQADLSNVFHSWSAQATLNPMVFEGGLGVKLWDFEGNEYLDFSSMLVNVNIGHQHPKLIQAIKDQADVLTTVAPAHANLTRARAAEKILEHAPEGFV